MSLWNPFAFDVLGRPLTQKAPPVLRVLSGELTASTHRLAQGAFYRFCESARLSFAPNPVEMGKLADGTPYKIIDVGGQRTMLVWPDGANNAATDRLVSWPSFVSTRFLPLWPRPVIDLPPYEDESYPPPPERPADTGTYKYVDVVGMMESDPALTEVPWSFGGSSGVNYTGTQATKAVVNTTEYTPSGAVVSTAVAAEITGTMAYSVVGDTYKFQRISYSTAYRVYNPTTVEGGWARRAVTGLSSNNPQFIDDVGTTGWDEPWEVGAPEVSCAFDSHGVWVCTPTGGADHKKPHMVEGGLWDAYLSALDAASAHNAASRAAYEAVTAAWRAAYQAWLDGMPGAPPDIGEFYTPLVAARASSRAVQIDAVAQWLLNGIGQKAHLNARLLSFPFNIAVTAEAPDAGLGGGDGATHFAPTFFTDGTAVWPTILNGCTQHEVVPPKPHSGYQGTRDDDEFEVMRDFLPGGPLYKWRISLYYTEFAQAYYRQPLDSFEVRPRDWLGGGSTLSMPSNDYAEGAPIVKVTGAESRVIDHDALVPVGTKITVVYLEYEVYDPFSRQWLWTPCPNIMLTDSVLVKNLALYRDDPTLSDRETTAKTRRARVWKIVRQTRTAWTSWSAPAIETPTNPEEFDYVVQAANIQKLPVAAVMAEKLAAWPSPTQSRQFPFGATYIYRSAANSWVGNRPAWESDGAGANSLQFVWAALKAAGVKT